MWRMSLTEVWSEEWAKWKCGVKSRSVGRGNVNTKFIKIAVHFIA